MADLHVNLKGEYFDDIKAGIKPFEYRLFNDYWKKRLVGREYDNVIIKRGYPSRFDTDSIITLPYRGYEIQRIQHPHFGEQGLYEVEVFAIRVGEPKLELLTDFGQLSEGDPILIYSKSDSWLPAKVDKVMFKGMNREVDNRSEEIIYNGKYNHYFITSMVLNGESWHKEVYRIRPAA